MPEALSAQIVKSLRPISDYPRLGTTFYDSMPVLRQGALLKAIVEALAEPFLKSGVTHVVGIEPQGQILGGAVAAVLGAGFISARKPRKLPWIQVRQVYALEYGNDAIEANRDEFVPSDRVIVVDDVLSSGKTAAATGDLVRALNGTLVGYSFMIEETAEGGRARLGSAEIHSIVQM
jgi:adenine phosphoribosyltransferase